ncbi:MAG: hypothetical protein KME46_34510 [Brasilonema angustatum HA4187-MV1]|jgi:hypothetical protein|nr:hypothetical protein [Brasilonema angustatum HA4187-MV1]
MASESPNKAVDSSARVENNNFDRGITPAETAARLEREQDLFKGTPEEEGGNSIDTTKGFTTDQEGLTNNHAIEPEMYYDTPGDARQVEVEDTAERTEDLAEVNEDKQGELTVEGDQRGKGPGAI